MRPPSFPGRDAERRIWAASAFDEKRGILLAGRALSPCEMKDRLEAYDFADARWSSWPDA